jgi:hypothetical protein
VYHRILIVLVVVLVLEFGSVAWGGVENVDNCQTGLLFGRDELIGRSQAVNCLATISPSLQDKVQQDRTDKQPSDTCPQNDSNPKPRVEDEDDYDTRLSLLASFCRYRTTNHITTNP